MGTHRRLAALSRPGPCTKPQSCTSEPGQSAPAQKAVGGAERLRAQQSVCANEPARSGAALLIAPFRSKSPVVAATCATRATPSTDRAEPMRSATEMQRTRTHQTARRVRAHHGQLRQVVAGAGVPVVGAERGRPRRRRRPARARGCDAIVTGVRRRRRSLRVSHVCGVVRPPACIAASAHGTRGAHCAVGPWNTKRAEVAAKVCKRWDRRAR